MKLAGEKPKDKANQLASLLPINKMVAVSLPKHLPDDAYLVDCYLATQASIKGMLGNVPSKRKDAGGKDATPATITIIFDNGTEHPLKLKHNGRNISYAFHLVLEDIDYSLGVGKIIIKVPSATITIKEI